MSKWDEAVKHWKSMKPSERAGTEGVICAVVVGALLAWFIPEAHWSVYLVMGVVSGAGWYHAGLDHEAKRNQADRDHD